MHSVFLGHSSGVHFISVWATTEVYSLYYQLFTNDLGRNLFSNRADSDLVDQQGNYGSLKLDFRMDEWDRPRQT